MLSCRAMYSYSYMCMKIYDSSCTPQEHLPSSQRVHQVTASAREQNWCQACVMHSSPRKEDTGASLSSKEHEAWQLVVCLSFVGWQSYLLHVRIHVHATRESVVCLCCRWPRSRSEFFFFFFWVTGELSTLCRMAKVPNEPCLRQNSGSATLCPSDQSMASNPNGASKTFGAMTTSRV